MVRGRLRFVFVVCFIVVAAFAGSASRAALAVAPQPSQSAAIPSVDVIFKRHHAALGKLPALAARWSGGITDNGQIARYEVTATREGLYRRTYILPLVQRSEGSNGTLDWEQDENGNVQTSPAEHRSPMDERLVRLNDMRFDSNGAAFLGVATVDGRRSYSVSMQVHGTSATVYFDIATALIDGVDFGSNTVRYRAYRRFEGVAVPVQIAETSPDETVTITVDNVDFLQASRGQFDPPEQRMPKFPSGIHEVDVNFDSPHGLIVCPAHINGHAVRFLIDSGSTTSIIGLDLAKRLGLPTGGFSRVQGAGMFTGTVARIDSLDLGGIRFEPLFMQAVQLSLPSRIAHEGIDGILGYDVLAPLVARISYKHGQIKFIDPGAFSYSGTGTTIPIDTAKHVPIISASIGKDHTGLFSVDTGSTAALVLYRHFADANRVDFLNPSEHDFELRQPIIFDPNDFGPTMASGAGGDFPTRVAVVDRLNLGSFSLPELVTEIIMREEGAFGSSSSTDGIVGGGSLAFFDAVFFDYTNKRMILEK